MLDSVLYFLCDTIYLTKLNKCCFDIRFSYTRWGRRGAFVSYGNRDIMEKLPQANKKTDV